MLFLNIGSGSKGNASFINTGETNLLIDAGLSVKRINKALKKVKKEVGNITDLIITHEHSDHVNGFLTLFKNNNFNLYMTKGTAEALKIVDYHEIVALKDFQIGNLTITPLPLSHDANEPIGLIIRDLKASICYITDTGYIPYQILPLLENHHLYFLEANHDPFTLTTSSRPLFLKNRIAGEKGHLSNYDSAYQFSLMAGTNTKHLIHAHISEDCNNNDLIKKAFQEVLDSKAVNYQEITFYYAKQNESLDVIYL